MAHYLCLVCGDRYGLNETHHCTKVLRSRRGSGESVKEARIQFDDEIDDLRAALAAANERGARLVTIIDEHFGPQPPMPLDDLLTTFERLLHERHLTTEELRAKLADAEERAERAERERDEARRLLSLERDGRAQLEGWRDGLERERDKAYTEGARLDREVERLQDELSAARARVARLEEVLGPIVKEFDDRLFELPDYAGVIFVSHQLATNLTVGDLRRAAAVMEEVSK